MQEKQRGGSRRRKKTRVLKKVTPGMWELAPTSTFQDEQSKEKKNRLSEGEKRERCRRPEGSSASETVKGFTELPALRGDFTWSTVWKKGAHPLPPCLQMRRGQPTRCEQSPMCKGSGMHIPWRGARGGRSDERYVMRKKNGYSCIFLSKGGNRYSRSNFPFRDLGTERSRAG